MNIILWIVQGILAVIFLMAGVMKLSQPKDILKEKIGGWVEGFSSGTIKIIGLLEFIGAIGVVLPMLIGVYPFLTAYAAIGLGLTMSGAMIVHIRRKETKEVSMNFVLLLLALFVAYGRI